MNTTFYDNRKKVTELHIHQQVEVVVSRYEYGGGLAIGLKTVPSDEYPFPEMWLEVTKNLRDHPAGDDRVFVRDWSENEGIVDLLVENGIIEETPLDKVKIGFVECKLFRLTDAFMDSGLIPSPQARLRRHG